jgi:uncharacterized membrane protein required for colicin V production
MDAPAGLGFIVDIIVTLMLIFSFIGGLKEGAVKEFLNLVAMLLALALTGYFMGYVTTWFNYVPDVNWRGLLGFAITLMIILIILGLLFWPLRAMVEKGWSGGALWSILGGIFGVMGAAIGLIVLVRLFDIYPVFDWLTMVFRSSQILNWLVMHVGPLLMMLPGSMRYV